MAYGFGFLEFVGMAAIVAMTGVLLGWAAFRLDKRRQDKERLKEWKIELCPFCKHKASIHELASDAAYVLCYECGAQTGIKPTISDAVAAWNRRAGREGGLTWTIMTYGFFPKASLQKPLGIYGRL